MANSRENSVSNEDPSRTEQDPPPPQLEESLCFCGDDESPEQMDKVRRRLEAERRYLRQPRPEQVSKKAPGTLLKAEDLDDIAKRMRNILESTEETTDTKPTPFQRRGTGQLWIPGPVPVPYTHLWLRWNILWFLVLCLVIIPLPLWMYPVNCYAGFVVLTLSNVWISAFLILCMIRASYTIWRMYRTEKQNIDYVKHYPKTKEGENVVHVAVMAGYKEPLELMKRTLDSVKAQTVANRILMVVALEERSPDFEEKSQDLHSTYENCFLHLMITRHPKDVPGEIPGKCSNVNFAAREAYKQINRMGLFHENACTITSCDTDNLFPPKYFEYLGYDFFRRKNRLEVLWQAPLLYNYHLDERPFFVRITGVLRCIFMMGILIPQNINTMSVTSMSMALCVKGNFFHPHYQMDDIIDLLVRMIAIHKRVKICLIPYPVISGPTSGANFKEEVVEWARQAKRWTIGAAEVFHYFCVKFSQFDRCSGIIYGFLFTHYYGFILCAMSLFNLLGLIASLVYTHTPICRPADFLGKHQDYIFIKLIGLIVPYLCFAWMLVLDKLGTKLIHVHEKISFPRNVVHWLLTPVVLLVYSCIEFFALCEIAFFGKKVCKHDASKKDVLTTV